MLGKLDNLEQSIELSFALNPKIVFNVFTSSRGPSISVVPLYMIARHPPLQILMPEDEILKD